jgi:hypothetical protein
MQNHMLNTMHSCHAQKQQACQELISSDSVLAKIKSYSYQELVHKQDKKFQAMKVVCKKKLLFG